MTGAGANLALSDDEIMMGLTVLRQRMSPITPTRFIVFLQRYHRILFPTLARFGWWQSPKDDIGYLRAFEAAQARWRDSNARAAQVGDEIILAALPNGVGFIGRRSHYQATVEHYQYQRTMRTLDNIRSSPAGTGGYLIGGDAGSDVGALLGDLASAAGRTSQARAGFKALSTPPPYRPEAAQIAPASGSRATGGPATDWRGTGASGALGPKTPTPPPSTPATTPQAPPAATAAPGAVPRSAGRGRFPSGSAGGQAGSGSASGNAPSAKASAKKSASSGSAGSGPPPKSDIASQTMAKLRAHKIDVDDAATLEKLSQIYGNYQNPEAFLKAARAGTGELRVLVRASKMPGVKCVRFLRPARGTVTPDIEVEMRDGRRTYVEVRTLTQAPDWAQIKDRARRRPESIVFISSVEEKIRLGQISRSRPGILVIHAPFQKVTSTSLEGWRDVLNDIRSRGPFPAGLARIEISGGSGGGLLIFQPRDWKGVIVE